MVMAGSTVVAQLISVSFSPIITRIYEPDVYGLFGLFLSIVNIAIPLANLAYPYAIVLPKDRSEFEALLRICFFGVAIFSIIFFFTGFLLKDNTYINNHWPSFQEFYWLLPLVIFPAALYPAYQQSVIRLGGYSALAKVAVLQALVIGVTKVVLGMIEDQKVSSLAFGNFLGFSISCIFLYLIQNRNKPKEKAYNLFFVAKKFRDFPMYRAPNQIINAFSQSVPVLTLAFFSGPAAAGFYTLAASIMSVSSQLIGKSVKDVFYPKISLVIADGGDAFTEIKKTTMFMAIIAAAPLLVFIAFGPFLFSTIFGDSWTKSGQFAQWLGVWLFFSMLNVPSTSAIPALQLQGVHLSYEIASTACRFFSILIGLVFLKSDIKAIMLLSLTGVFLNMLLIGYVFNKAANITVSDGENNGR